MFFCIQKIAHVFHVSHVLHTKKRLKRLCVFLCLESCDLWVDLPCDENGSCLIRMGWLRLVGSLNF